ncbi:MAG: serine/threonine protein kinase [Proteobacteria bacterium]|nr:serine/threonine protein kinase [Pseudomonadota bacterium]
MQTIKLIHEIWEIDTKKALGSPGGFGEVFLGKGSSGEVAIKQLKLTATQAAHRELQIGQSLFERSLQHVVPILDYGQDADSDRYYIVMPVCDRSLQDYIDDKGVGSPADCIEILLAILCGLKEAKDITHRDIKPLNILMHEAKWKIADFGIAKFVEDSTSLETLRNSLTPAYAAPEQWLLQRPTSATDIYAVGCIAHGLSTGAPPFSGDVDSLREQHLKETPESLDSLPASVRGLVSQMMRKNPDIRPSLERCITVLENARGGEPQNVRGVEKRLAKAVSELAVTQARKEADQQARDERRRNREAVFDEAASELAQIKKRLFGEINHHAQDVRENTSNDSVLRIGNATLAFDTAESASSVRGLIRSDLEQIGGSAGWGVHKQQSKWDIVAFTNISIEQIGDHNFYKRCANIVFGRPSNDSDYRWYEMAFWSLSSSPVGWADSYPFCLDYVWEIDEALSSVMAVNNLAYDPVPIDAEDADSFIEYWMDIVTQAIVGKLVKPSHMPMNR